MIKLSGKTFMMIAIYGLTACSSIKNYDCPNKAGVMCKSLGQVDSMVNSGQLQGKTQLAEAKNGNTKADFQPSALVSDPYVAGQPLRYGETVQRVWIAPYEDTEGDYHQDNIMYSVMRGGHWMGSPIKETSEF